MNEEYVLVGGLFWKLFNIPVYLWRNHPKGSILTRIAVFLSTKVFSTSTDSFTSRFKKTVICPVGYNEKIFRLRAGIIRKKYSVLMLGRISRVKHIGLGLYAIRLLVERGIQVTLTVAGTVFDYDYFEYLKNFIQKYNLGGSVLFETDVTKENSPLIFGSHEITLNTTTSGSFDKTIVEAAACGSIPLVSNSSLRTILPSECLTSPDPISIANKIEKLLNAQTQVEIEKELERFVRSQSLSSLMEKLEKEMK
jgi:glycosyltransferase involved in cell wall biosynthesis